MPQQTTETPQLVVLAPEAYRGRRIPLPDGDVFVGREASCDIHFDDPYVSRVHAVLRRHGDTVSVRDLDSSAGTLVNGAAAGTGGRELRPGDIVALADVRLRYQLVPAGETAHFEIDQQQAGVINNVGRDQYIAYVQQREGFLREIAATRTKARWLIWIGFLCFVAGFGLFGAGVVGFISKVVDEMGSSDPQPPENIFGPEIGGVPAGLLGWALAGVGALLALIGIVLHVVATSRRKRVDRELPVPPPWPARNQ
jgi:hypothetical protein